MQMQCFSWPQFSRQVGTRVKTRVYAMTKVKALRPHLNVHGNHKAGDEYDHDRPAVDIKFGYVRKVKARSKAADGADNPST